MKLLIDVGNSNVKWSVAEKGKLASSGEFAHKGKRFGQKQPDWIELPEPESVVVSNVAGERMQKYIDRWCESHWSVKPEYIVSQKRRFGITNSYAVPESLGVDRWAAIIAAKRLYKSACCVIDCGTAVTCDVINKSGKHLGGFILPGPKLSQEMLIKHTNIAVPVEDGAPTGLLGTDTATCISGGAYYAVIATIDRVVDDLQQEVEMGIELIMTGGGAERISRLTHHDWILEPQLVLEGLNVISQGK